MRLSCIPEKNVLWYGEKWIPGDQPEKSLFAEAGACDGKEKGGENFFGEELRRENKNSYRIPYSTVQGEGEMPVLEMRRLYLQPVREYGRSRKPGKLAESGRLNKASCDRDLPIPVFEQEEYDILLNPEGLGGVES